MAELYKRDIEALEVISLEMIRFLRGCGLMIDMPDPVTLEEFLGLREKVIVEIKRVSQFSFCDVQIHSLRVTPSSISRTMQVLEERDTFGDFHHTSARVRRSFPPLEPEGLELDPDDEVELDPSKIERPFG